MANRQEPTSPGHPLSALGSRLFALACRGAFDSASAHPPFAMKLSLLPVIAAALALTACESTRGVLRTVRIRDRVPQGAVVAAIASVPGVELANQRHDTPKNGYGIVQFRARSTDTFQYVAAARQADGVIEIGGNEREGLRLRMYCLWQNIQPTPTQIAATRRLMDDIYASLRRQAPEYVPPPERVHEDLIGVSGGT